MKVKHGFGIVNKDIIVSKDHNLTIAAKFVYICNYLCYQGVITKDELEKELFCVIRERGEDGYLEVLNSLAEAGWIKDPDGTWDEREKLPYLYIPLGQ